MSKYAPGTQAWGRCQRCSQKFLLRDLVFDGYMPGLRVCVDCYDPIHPQEFLQDTADPVALWQPSPEYGPAGPQLTITQGTSDNLLNWTKADPRGGALISNYTVMRATSYDGVNFLPFVPIYNVVVQYDSFGLLLFDPDHPVDYDPYIPPGETIVDPYTFDDTTITPGVFYQYYVAAYFTKHRFVPSNYVLVGEELVVAYLTSRIYPIEDIENFTSVGSTAYQPQYQNDEAFNSIGAIVAGTFLTALVTYSNWPAEDFNSVGAVMGGTLMLGLVSYSNGLPEDFNSVGSIVAGTLFDALIVYSNWPAENFNSVGSIVGGTLS